MEYGKVTREADPNIESMSKSDKLNYEKELLVFIFLDIHWIPLKGYSIRLIRFRHSKNWKV